MSPLDGILLAVCAALAVALLLALRKLLACQTLPLASTAVPLEFVEALALAVDLKDAYTREHSGRARSQARRLTAELKIPAATALHVEYAALLHDIGKIAIDQSLLLKPSPLTPQEYEILKRHPAIGYQILALVPSLGPVARIVFSHQEHYDGSGYPSGLQGEDIPLGSRIIAVIDAWDAMTSDRPYRKALPREAALLELRRCTGTQFDPQVVEAFLKIEAPGA